MTRFEITAQPVIRAVLRSRWPQLALTAAALAGMVLAIVSGWAGTSVGSRSFGIVFVWIGWWALLMLCLVPFFGRAWCSICPIPAPGEWLQRGAVLGPAGKGLGLHFAWPRSLRNIWLQNGLFVVMALFSLVLLTQPGVTATVLALLMALALLTSLVFERRAFCRYLCPVGGFIGLYAQLAPVEVRVKDPAVCAAHTEKTCYTGNADGYGCPWQVYPGGLAKNTYCGTCLECLRTCPRENVAINLRPFGADLAQPRGRRLDEAFKAFIMLGSALAYSVVMLGPWGRLKSAAYAIGTLPWLAYAGVFLALLFLILPGMFWVAVRLGRALSQWRSPRAAALAPPSTSDLRQSYVALACSLVPLGLCAWIAFSLAFVFANASYLWPALSDPLAQGWNLFGAAGAAWTPYLTAWVPSLQAFVLIGGLAWAALTALNIAGEKLARAAAVRQALPVVGYQLLITILLLGVLVG